MVHKLLSCLTITVVIIALPGCIMQETAFQRRERIESKYLTTKQQYKKEIKILDDLKKRNEEPKEQIPTALREVILMKYERSDFPFIVYKDHLDSDIRTLKKMMHDVMSTDAPMLYQNIKTLRRALKQLNRYVVTSKDLWKEKKAYKQSNPSIIPIPIPIPVKTETNVTHIKVYE